MKIILQRNFYGYCPGLKRSFQVADELIEKAKAENKKIFCDVPLAHNADVMSSLRRQGVELIEMDENSRGEGQYFLVSAHGASTKKVQWLKKIGFKVWDATCPKVTTVQHQALADYKSGYQIVIFGKANHAEIEGINGLVNKSAIIIDDTQRAKEIVLTKKTSVISQTTLPVERFKEVFDIIKKNNPNIEIIARKTICPIVQNRITQIVEFAKSNGINRTVVVGSPTSSNTKSLAKALSAICPTSMVADERSLDQKSFTGDETVLVVSGTSAPPEVVEKVAEKLARYKF